MAAHASALPQTVATLNDTTVTTFKWIVENFSLQPKGINDKLSSPVFAIKNNKDELWRMEFYANGYGMLKYPVLFLRLIESKQPKVLASFDFSIINEDGTPVETVFERRALPFYEGTGHGLRLHLTRDCLNKKVKTPDNKLTIFCRIKTCLGNQTAAGVMPPQTALKSSGKEVSNTTNTSLPTTTATIASSSVAATETKLKQFNNSVTVSRPLVFPKVLPPLNTASKNDTKQSCGTPNGTLIKKTSKVSQQNGDHYSDAYLDLLEADEILKKDLEEQSEFLQSCDDEFYQAQKEYDEELELMLLEADEISRKDAEEQSEFLQSCDAEFYQAQKEYDEELELMLLEADEILKNDLEEQSQWLQDCEDDFYLDYY